MNRKIAYSSLVAVLMGSAWWLGSTLKKQEHTRDASAPPLERPEVSDGSQVLAAEEEPGLAPEGRQRIASSPESPGALQFDASDARTHDLELAATSALELEIWAAADSFQTESPDLSHLLALANTLANDMELVSGSLEKEESTGLMTGKLKLGAGMTGRFVVVGDSYSIEVVAADSASESRRQLTIQFEEDRGSAGPAEISLLTFPSKVEGATNLAGKELTGWSAKIRPGFEGKLHRKITTVVDPGGDRYLYQIREDELFEPLPAPHAAGSPAFDSWRSRLLRFQDE